MQKQEINKNEQKLKPLPLGIQTFSDIIVNDYIYIDKTKIIHEMLAKEKGAYFLSRPRRFGKSLLVDTLKEIFEGNQNLFKGLWIYDKWNWEEKYPTIKISFGLKGTDNSVEGLQKSMDFSLNEIIKYENLESEIEIEKNIDIALKFRNLIQLLNKKYSKKVVILID